MMTGLCPGGQKRVREKEGMTDNDRESKKGGQMREKTQISITWHTKNSRVLLETIKPE